MLNKAKLKVYSEFKYNKKIEILEKSSLKAAKLIKNNSLNFVYIDANHKYNFVKQDLNIWWPKLKKHGILFGDDYFSKSKEKYGVIKAVNEFVFKKKTIVHHTDNFKQYFFIKK